VTLVGTKGTFLRHERSGGRTRLVYRNSNLYRCPRVKQPQSLSVSLSLHLQFSSLVLAFR
jgi:hypothetical protein